jgi:hypothetical protein
MRWIEPDPLLFKSRASLRRTFEMAQRKREGLVENVAARIEIGLMAGNRRALLVRRDPRSST